MRKINSIDLNDYFKSNRTLANLIKSNLEYLGKKFKYLKDYDPRMASEDTGVLYFMASYFASNSLKFSDNYLIVSDMDNSKKVYVFAQKKIYIFFFDEENDKANVEFLDNYIKTSFLLNYDSRKKSVYILNSSDGLGFVNKEFNGVSSNIFENTKNPEVSFVTLRLDFVNLEISSRNSNLDIDSIIKFVEKF